MGKKPHVIGAMALLWGYMVALWNRKTPLVTKAEATCYQTLLNERMKAKTKALFARRFSVSIQ
jgi:hypothetical protein